MIRPPALPPVPPALPPARVVCLPGRGEVFFRHHVAEGAADRPTLVLLHGWTASTDLQWFTAYEELGERYSFVAIDHRGHGRGMRTLERFRLEDAADDVASLIEVLGLTKVVVLGYSMGGPISLHLCHRHPHLVHALVLEATALEWRATRRDRSQWWFLLGFEAVLRWRITFRLQHRAIRRMARQNPGLASVLPWLVAESRRGDPTALTDAGRALRDYDARGFAGEIDVPVGVLRTTKDHVVSPRKQTALAKAMRAEIVDLPGDHFCTWAQPALFSAATRRLVDGVVARLDQSAAAEPSGASRSI